MQSSYTCLFLSFTSCRTLTAGEECMRDSLHFTSLIFRFSEIETSENACERITTNGRMDEDAFSFLRTGLAVEKKKNGILTDCEKGDISRNKRACAWLYNNPPEKKNTFQLSMKYITIFKRTTFHVWY